MSSGDFASELQQSVQDHLALIAAAAKAAKSRIGAAVEVQRAPTQPAASPAVERPQPSPRVPRPAVNFDVREDEADSAFASAALSEADAFAAEPAPGALPRGAISFDDLAVEGVDDEGIPVWEESP
ncbi:MAG TPA: hypothetical protein VMF11_03345 [Candidatus Baltobacteraceae bacterium]|nr:hypothetical protein [Candidatus Baltobacteraceae bacterium]